MAAEKEKTAKAVKFYRTGIVAAVVGLILSFWGQSQVSGDLAVLARTPIGDLRIVDVVFCFLLVAVALFLLGGIYTGGKRIPVLPKRDGEPEDVVTTGASS